MTKITDEGLKTIIQTQTKLKVLDLSNFVLK